MFKFLVRRYLSPSSSNPKLLTRFLFPCSTRPISAQGYAVSNPTRLPNNPYLHRARVFGSDASATASIGVSPSTSDGLTIDRIIAYSWTILDEHQSDWKSHASAIAQSLHLIKKRLKWEKLVVRLGLLSAELDKPNLWDDPVHAGKISREHGMLLGKMKEVKAFEQALYEHIDMLKLAREEGDAELESEIMNALLKMRADLKDKEIEALLAGDTDSCSCFIE